MSISITQSFGKSFLIDAESQSIPQIEKILVDTDLCDLTDSSLRNCTLISLDDDSEISLGRLTIHLTKELESIELISDLIANELKLEMRPKVMIFNNY